MKSSNTERVNAMKTFSSKKEEILANTGVRKVLCLIAAACAVAVAVAAPARVVREIVGRHLI